MTLKEQLINDIEQMPLEDLALVQNLVSALKRKAQTPVQGQDDHHRVRQALAGCAGNLADDVISDREDRL